MRKLNTSLVILLVISGVGVADDGPFRTTSKTKFMYELGGGSIVAPAPHKSKVKLNLSAKLSLGYSCGNFDPAATIKNGLNNLKKGVDDAANAIVGAASGAVASLPLYMFQRANPDLTGIFKDWMNEYQGKFEADLKSCEQREAEILSGEGAPYGDLVKISQQAGFTEATEKSDGDITVATEEASKKGACINYIGGIKAGCEGKTSINTTKDVALAGYAIIANVPPKLDQTAQIASAASGSRMKEVIGSPEDAMAFAVRVLGSAEFASLDKGAGPKTTPGRGLHPEIEDAYDALSDAVDIIFDVDGSGDMPTESHYELVKTPSIDLRSPAFISSIRSFSLQERAYFAERIKWEVATAKVLDKALMLKRLLISGAKEPNIYGVSSIQNETRRMVDELDKEITSLVFEKNVRKEYLSESVFMLMEEAENRNAKGSVMTPSVN